MDMADCNKTEIFLREKYRMCLEGCDKCKLFSNNNGTNNICNLFINLHPEETIALVQRWSDDHPYKTRQTEFLKTFPNAGIRENGALSICPMMVDVTYKCVYKTKNCCDCQKEYWDTEIE